jgi:DNA-binding NarL/FixJ family response regulator
MPRYTALIVEDFKEFSRFVVLTLQQRAEIGPIYEASDGLEGVQRAEELQPDLIVLDIALPRLNGIEGARRIRKVSPNSKILFLTQESSAEVVEVATQLGARGYVLKINAADEFLVAVDAVLQGRQFFGRGLKPTAGNERGDSGAARSVHSVKTQPSWPQTGHIAASYRDETSLVDGFVGFAEAALTAGDPIIVIATEVHLASIRQRLEAIGWDIAAAIQEGHYISLNASDVLSTVMVDGWPQSAQVMKGVGDLVTRAAQTAKRKNPRVKACGEMGPILLAGGNGRAAIQLEHLTDEIVKSCDVDVLCGYTLDDIQTGENSKIFERICAEHSAVYSV